MGLRKTQWLPPLAFAIMLLAGLYLVHRDNENWKIEQFRLIGEIASSQALVIERRLNRSLSAAYILGSLVRQNNGYLPNFESYAADMLTHIGGITNLQLAPDGIVEKIFPLKGHEDAIGHNILGDDKRRSKARSAIATKKLTLAGPFELVQGGIAIIGRYPVFLNDPIDADLEFWGFTSVLIYLEDFLDLIDINNIESKGYIYQLAKSSSETEDMEVFSGVDVMPLHHTIKQEIFVPNSKWYLSIAPKNISDYSPYYVHKLLLLFILAAMMTYLLYFLLKQPEVLQNTIDEKTRELQKLAYFDQLTNLENREIFLNKLSSSIDFKKEESNFSLIFLDLDNFKKFNDSLGHQVGDEILKQAATRLRAIVRKNDNIARIGGDEFAILLRNVSDKQQVEQIAQKLIGVFKEPFEVGKFSLTVTASIGITIAPWDSTDTKELLRNADLAMYQAKQKGRNNYRYYSTDTHTKASLASDLFIAMEKQEFLLEYEPVIGLETSDIVSVEALLKWRHPYLGILGPEEFLPIAEESDLIINLGKWILDEACKTVVRLNSQSKYPIGISIDISFTQLNNRKFLNGIVKTLRDYGLKPELLQIKITESTIIDKMEEASKYLVRLKDLGISICMDNFGKGYSSLTHIKYLPIDTIKLDKEFILNSPRDEKSNHILSGIATITDSLNVAVVAEGIETESQRDFLIHQCGFRYGQGDLFKPQHEQLQFALNK